MRANLIIAASDLVCRFPNAIEPWTPFIYSRLGDSEVSFSCDILCEVVLTGSQSLFFLEGGGSKCDRFHHATLATIIPFLQTDGRV